MDLVTLLVVIVLWASGCGATGAAGTSVVGSSGEPPPVVRARCGGCHALPVPDPLRDRDAVWRWHMKRLGLSSEEAAEVSTWLSGGPH